MVTGKDLQKGLRAYATSSNAISKENSHNPTDAKIDPYGTGVRPEPFRNGQGASILGPRNLDREKQAPDMIRPPSTDSGHLPNLKWSFADSHMKIEVRFEVGGLSEANEWIPGRWMGERNYRQRTSHKVSACGIGHPDAQGVVTNPDSIELAGVNMRLDEGAIRELHWHKEVFTTLNHPSTRLKDLLRRD